uniref:Ig-like domain-containing protein n=1 Tax=Terrapene triunguis TaxID=2587831 RepID=A0A674JJJ2_9SAUR
VTIVIDKDWAHHYFMIAQLDDIKILYYSSDTREVRTTKEWAAQALGAEFFQNKTQEFWTYDEDSKGDGNVTMPLVRLNLSPSPAGVHTEQIHVGCALSNQAPVDPRFQYAYDGGDFISFDNQTGTWVAAVQPAFLQKQLWETGKTWTQYVQWCLQHECMGTLRILLQHGMGVLEQQVPPIVSAFRRDSPDGSITLSCHARGFYPRPIHISWVRDGEDILAEMDSSGILPYADSTYYRQSSLEISPQQEDGHRYACRVEHSSLPEPTLVWGEGEGTLPPGAVAAIVLALAGAVGASVILWKRKSAGKSRSPQSQDVGRVWGVGWPSQPKGGWLLLPPPRTGGAGHGAGLITVARPYWGQSGLSHWLGAMCPALGGHWGGAGLSAMQSGLWGAPCPGVQGHHGGGVTLLPCTDPHSLLVFQAPLLR